ncbi:IS110 family transposase [Streptomyces sp. A1499]|nr:IS110 family transposase [Streptomyces sp. A1499]
MRPRWPTTSTPRSPHSKTGSPCSTRRPTPRASSSPAPGLGVVSAAGILGRLGDPNRFASLAGIRAFTGLVPRVSQSGLGSHNGPPTRSGDPGLREALFKAVDRARGVDPTLAARYHDLVVRKCKHHNSALCTLAAVLVTRLAACWRNGTRYKLRDTDGREITEVEERQICATRYKIERLTGPRSRSADEPRDSRTPRRAGAERSRMALRQPARLPTTLRTPSREHHNGLDLR